MSDPTRLLFRERHRTTGVRLERREEFERDPLEWIWDRRDPDDRDDRAWLDANAPGWTTEIVRKGVHEIDLPLGRDPKGTFLRFDVVLAFVDARHRQAWRDRVAGIRDTAETQRARALAAREAAPEGVEVCALCGGSTAASRERQVHRIAQIEIRFGMDVRRCTECRASTHGGIAYDAVVEAMGEVERRVGLPAYPEDPGWTEDTPLEWRRRRLAPPAIVVEMPDGMDAAALLAEIERQGGRPPPSRSRPVLVVVTPSPEEPS